MRGVEGEYKQTRGKWREREREVEHLERLEKGIH